MLDPMLNRFVLLFDQNSSISRARAFSPVFSRTFVEDVLVYMPLTSSPPHTFETAACRASSIGSMPVLHSVRMLKVHSARTALSANMYDGNDVLEETARRICKHLEEPDRSVIDSITS